MFMSFLMGLSLVGKVQLDALGLCLSLRPATQKAGTLVSGAKERGPDKAFLLREDLTS
jgi:hypothetical protein